MHLAEALNKTEMLQGFSSDLTQLDYGIRKQAAAAAQQL
jgi:hypothetical protein